MRPIHTNLPAPTAGMLLAKRPTGIIMAFVVLLIAFTLQSIPSLFQELPAAILQGAGGATTEPTQPGGLGRADGVVALFSFGIILLWLWFWAATKERRRLASFGFTQPRVGVFQAARGFGVGVAMMAACLFIPVVIGQATLTWASPDATSWLFILIMLGGFLVQGSTEEVATRGYLTQAVARRWGLVAAVIIQAVFFTLLHSMNSGIGVMPIINLMLFAFFATAYSLAEGNLWGICAMHGAWNWAQGNLFGVPVSGNAMTDSVFGYNVGPDSIELLTGGAFGIEGSLVTTAVYLAGTAIAWRVWQKRRAANASVPLPGSTSVSEVNA